MIHVTMIFPVDGLIVAMALGTSNILNWESAFIGTQWNNVGQDTENYKMSDAIFLMFFDALLYGFISWYILYHIPSWPYDMI